MSASESSDEKTAVTGGESAVVADAGALINARRFREAIDLLGGALLGAPEDPELNYLLGVAAYRAGGKDSAAFAGFKRAVRADRRHVDALLGLGLTARRLGRLEEARSAFRAVGRADPTNEEANEKARWYLREMASPAVAPAAGPAAAVPPGLDSTDPAALSLAELLDARGRPRPDEATLAGPVVWAGQPSLRSLGGAAVGAAVIAVVAPRLVRGLASALPAGPGRVTAAALWRVVEAASWPVALVLLAAQLATLVTRRYVLRKHRVDLFAGLVNRQQVTLWLHDLERPVLINQNLWALALQLGSVELDSTILRPPRGRRGRGLPGRLLLSGLSIGVAEEIGGVIRAESLWQRRRMVQNFVSSR